MTPLTFSVTKPVGDIVNSKRSIEPLPEEEEGRKVVERGRWGRGVKGRNEVDWWSVVDIITIINVLEYILFIILYILIN